MRGGAVDGPIEAEVVVIGGGIAGAAAALAARRLGRNVALVRRSWGASALHSGTLELAGDPLATPENPRGERRQLLACIRALARRRRHPWQILEARLSELGPVLAAAREESGGRLAFGPLDEENVCLLTSLGTLKTTAGGWDGVLDGDLRAGGRIGVVGLRGHPAWDAELLVESLELLAPAAELPISARPIPCDLLQRSEEYALLPHQLAARIEADPEPLVEAIRRSLPGGVDRLLLPPLLGRGDPRPILALLEERLQIPCAEMPAAGTAPLPGLRLQRLLESRLEETGVALLWGEVFAPDGDPASLRVRSAEPEIADPGHFDGGPIRERAPDSFPVRARAVILATGRFLGGGIARSARLRETVFDLPVVVDGEVDEGRWLGAHTSSELAAEQRAFAAGVAVDERLRPLDRDGTPRSPFLFACGSVIAGNDPARSGAGAGLSWCTGWLAGQAAARAGA